VAVFDTVKALQTDRFAAGDVFFDLSNDGVGIGKISPQVPASIRDAVEKRQREIAAGTVAGIPDEVR
jgi:basic membrane protein A and related proteins